LAERVVLPRKNRQQALSEYAQRYADKLEYYCQKNPYNWFNFFINMGKLPWGKKFYQTQQYICSCKSNTTFDFCNCGFIFYQP